MRVTACRPDRVFYLWQHKLGYRPAGTAAIAASADKTRRRPDMLTVAYRLADYNRDSGGAMWCAKTLMGIPNRRLGVASAGGG